MELCQLCQLDQFCFSFGDGGRNENSGEKKWKESETQRHREHRGRGVSGCDGHPYKKIVDDWEHRNRGKDLFLVFTLWPLRLCVSKSFLPAEVKARAAVGLRRFVSTLRACEIELGQLHRAKNATKIGTWPTWPIFLRAGDEVTKCK